MEDKSGQHKNISGKTCFARTFWFKISATAILFLTLTALKPLWGFWAHKRINRLAVFRLPPEMQVFYKENIDFITENAVNPDRRRYAVVREAERHYIDLDVYGDSAFQILPKFWIEAVKQIGEDSLRKHGIVPWYIQTGAYQLTEAFKEKDARKILRISADLGHYIADAHVPLHTTRNYNGQLTGQEGIHGFWESRLPELFAEHYDLWIGQATYRDNVAHLAWQTVAESHVAADSVFVFEKQLSASFPPDKKFSYELRNNVLTRTYSLEFSHKYHQMLDHQVERRMRASVKTVADIWFTCWINAGQPDLSQLKNSLNENDKKEERTESQSWVRRLFHIRPESED
ncbi:zinc dependent phospholipase C family protein [Dyadobacter chenwenxiniae]|uniref:Zinc dependent phospholipase C family protein n=1 Tax=Dyadobacter chenwenxiniae TaxID=2906456 RepID=A0A9X1TFB6_9BACT|nr:zinc dependent phospholipase C family protein [Dyadobacter chenwenxiniae]MCF0062439.1 zinc dependent phospholipase C family protein [Dyadobacter chenwenxiniae]UON83811.1 zinc dependent phospholipase C family protein [Dyadobacter chenwenxiniae]